MIPNTLPNTQKATVCVLLPHPEPKYKGFPTPSGTAFFVSNQGHLITARHVIQKEDKTLYPPNQIQITKPGILSPPTQVSQIVRDWPSLDLACLKIDRQQTDFLQMEFSTVAEGTEVYSFGYPLAKIQIQGDEATMMVGMHFYSPRATSAIISSHYWYIEPFRATGGFPTHYVIDKALNYGNSGGPIVICETGRAISVCLRFQSVVIPQQGIQVEIPSLYGITVSLKNIQNDLATLNIV